jgi:hypothetical protein
VGQGQGRARVGPGHYRENRFNSQRSTPTTLAHPGPPGPEREIEENSQESTDIARISPNSRRFSPISRNRVGQGRSTSAWPGPGSLPHHRPAIAPISPISGRFRLTSPHLAAGHPALAHRRFSSDFADSGAISPDTSLTAYPGPATHHAIIVSPTLAHRISPLGTSMPGPPRLAARHVARHIARQLYAHNSTLAQSSTDDRGNRDHHGHHEHPNPTHSADV